MILVFKKFLQTSIPPLIYVIYARGYHDFPLKKSRLTVPKNFVGETFSVSLISGIERFDASEIYLTILCQIFFCLSAEKFRRGTFLICVSEKIWYRIKIMDKRGGGEGGGSITIFSRKFLVSQCQNISWASLQCSRKFGVSKNFMHNRGYHVFPSNNDGLTEPKTFADIASKFQKIGVSKNLMHNSITIFRRKYFVSRCRKNS